LVICAFFRTVSVVGAVLLVTASPGAQQTVPAPPPQTPPVFRGGTTIVPLDVKVLDKNGKPVTNLTQSDFTVYEDNVKQDIRSFSAQRFTPQPVPAGDEPALIRVARPDPLEPQTRRTFLLVLGYDSSQGARVHGPGKAPDGALTFVRERLLPQDLVAVMAFNRATDFTTNHARIEQVLDRYRRSYERIVFEITEFHERYPRMPLPPALQADMDAIFTGQTPAEALTAMKAPRGQTDTRMRNAADLLLRIDPALARRANTQRDEPSFDDVQDFSGRVLHLTLSDAVAETDLMKVYGGIEYLRHLDGEKHLVFLGRRIAFKHTEDDARLAARANDARVAIDIIHTAGIEASEAKGRSPGGKLDLDDLFRVSSAENIAEISGGYYTGVITAEKALAHIDESTRFSYLLGYAPTNPAADATLRH
jgi:VWFA-related protein